MSCEKAIDFGSLRASLSKERITDSLTKETLNEYWNHIFLKEKHSDYTVKIRQKFHNKRDPFRSSSNHILVEGFSEKNKSLKESWNFENIFPKETAEKMWLLSKNQEIIFTFKKTELKTEMNGNVVKKEIDNSNGLYMENLNSLLDTVQK
jgi:hypothetical protein